jgi:hypothetical protein
MLNDRKNSSLLTMAAILGLLQGPMPVGRYSPPKRGEGSGRVARCKKCGARGSVTEGPDGRRQIPGCHCPTEET